VRQTLDDAANVLGIQSYDPYGQIEAGSSLTSSFGYTGELQDSTTGNEYLRARWYQPGSATLLGVDPALDQTGQPYVYVGGDPVNGSDLSGTCWTTNTTNTYLLVYSHIGGNGRCQSSDPLTAMSDHSYALVGGAATALAGLKDYDAVAEAIRIAAAYDAASGEIPVVLGEAGEGLTTAQATGDAVAVEEAAVCPEAAAAGSAGGPAGVVVAVFLVAAGVFAIWAAGHWFSPQPTFDAGPQPLAGPALVPTPGPATQPKLQPTAASGGGYKARLARAGRLPKTDQNGRRVPEILYHYTNKDAALSIQAKRTLYTSLAAWDQRTGVQNPEGAYATDIAPTVRGYTQQTLAQNIYFNRARTNVSWFVALKNDESQSPPWIRVADHQFAILSNELMVPVQPIGVGPNPMPVS
jgi:RHS repeat-associated protein